MSSSRSGSSAFQKIMTDSCIVYAVIVIVLCVLLLFVSEGASRAVSPLNFLLVFPFSVLFSSANYIGKSTRLSSILRFIIHAVFTVGGFFVFLYLPAFSGSSESSSLVVFIVFLALYLIVYGTVILFRRRWKKELSAESDYTPQFASRDEKDRSNRSKP